jgi:lysozyme
VKNIKDILAFEEGLRLVPYLCSEDYVTIGYGTLLHKEKGLNPDDFPIRISAVTAGEWLEQDVHNLVLRLQSHSVFKKLNTERQTILISMAYQMGYSGLMGFRKMWAALDVGDWFEASQQAKDSLWYRQTPNRAGRHARVLEEGSMTVYDYAIDGVPHED